MSLIYDKSLSTISVTKVFAFDCALYPSAVFIISRMSPPTLIFLADTGHSIDAVTLIRLSLIFKNASGVLAAAWSNAKHSSTDHACDPPETHISVAGDNPLLKCGISSEIPLHIITVFSNHQPF